MIRRTAIAFVLLVAALAILFPATVNENPIDI